MNLVPFSRGNGLRNASVRSRPTSTNEAGVQPMRHPCGCLERLRRRNGIHSRCPSWAVTLPQRLEYLLNLRPCRRFNQSRRCFPVGRHPLIVVGPVHGAPLIPWDFSHARLVWTGRLCLRRPPASRLVSPSLSHILAGVNTAVGTMSNRPLINFSACLVAEAAPPA